VTVLKVQRQVTSSLKFEEEQQFRQRWVYFVYVLLFALLGLFIYAFHSPEGMTLQAQLLTRLLLQE
jgi:hypothetical protein